MSPADSARPALQAAIAALQAQRARLGDAVVDAAVAPLQAQLAALGAAAAPVVDELRLVSLLVLDVVGSTRLAQQLDPEDNSAVMDGALARFAATVRTHGGRVMEFAGDNLIGVFGLDGTREDDAERAVHCGLALLAASRHHAQQVLARHGHAGFSVRVGVHTGPVLRGSGSTSPLRSNTLTLARQMEHTAPPGSVQISHECWRHVQGRFEVRALPPQAVHGRDAPLPSYLVEAPVRADPTPWLVEGVATPLLGREAELAQLLATVAAVRADAQPRGVTLLAEAGLGKSRLVHELLQHVDAQGGLPTLRARGQQGGRLQPYKLLREMLAGWCGVADSDSAATAWERLHDALAALLPPAALADLPLLARLVGWRVDAISAQDAGDPRGMRDRGIAVFRAALAARVQRVAAPLLLLADDLHWADEASLDLLAQLLADGPALLLVASARPELLDHRPDWADGSLALHQRLWLQPLPGADSQALAGALLQHVVPPVPQLVDILVRQAGGNPYYMEELLKMFVDDGVVEAAPAEPGGRPVWRVRLERLVDVRPPSTLSGVLQARLDALAPAQRHALQHASIVGAVFWDQALAALAPEAPLELPALRARALVAPRPRSAFQGCSEDAFHHHVLHQVTYDTMPRARRRAGHAEAARWLAAQVNDRHGEHLATTAQHFLAAEDPQAAAHWLARAAEYAWDRFDNRTAYAQAKQALELLDHVGHTDRHELAARLLFLGIKVSDLLGEREQQARWVDAAEALLTSPVAGANWPVRVAYSRAVLDLRHDRHAAAQAAGLRTLALAQAVGDAERAAEVCNVLMVTARLQNDPAGARAHAGTGIALARAAGLRAVELRLQANLGLVDYEAGDFLAARRALAEALDLAQTHSSGNVILGILRCNLAGCEQELGNYEGARRWAQDAVDWSRKVGDVMADAVGSQNLAEALLCLGDPEAALPFAQHAVQASLGNGNRLFAAKAGLVVAEIELVQGRLDTAAAAAATAAGLFDDLEQVSGRMEAGLWQAAISLAQGERERAVDLLVPQLATLEQQLAQGAATARLPWLCHRVLAGAGDARAAEWLARTRRAVQAQADRLPDTPLREQFLARHVVARALRDYAG